jgi:hypothetical protein
VNGDREAATVEGDPQVVHLLQILNGQVSEPVRVEKGWDGR